MSEKIGKCPYCPVPTVTMVFNPNGDDAFVECSRCKTQGPSGKNEAEAIAKWNAAANALAKKDEEIEKLRDEMHSQDEALADAQDKRDKYYADWYAEHCRVEAGNRRQDELEAEIARLTAACDDLEGDMLKARDERDEAKAEIEKLKQWLQNCLDEAKKRADNANEIQHKLNDEIAEHRRHVAIVMQREANAIAEIERQRLAHTHYYDKYHNAIVERDEARRVARRLYARNGER